MPDNRSPYDGWTVFAPQVDNKDGEGPSVYEKTGPGRIVRTFNDGFDYWNKPGIAVDGDADDFQGLSLSAKYATDAGPPVDPCAFTPSFEFKLELAFKRKPPATPTDGFLFGLALETQINAVTRTYPTFRFPLALYSWVETELVTPVARIVLQGKRVLFGLHDPPRFGRLLLQGGDAQPHNVLLTPLARMLLQGTRTIAPLHDPPRMGRLWLQGADGQPRDVTLTPAARLLLQGAGTITPALTTQKDGRVLLQAAATVVPPPTPATRFNGEINLQGAATYSFTAGATSGPPGSSCATAGPLALGVPYTGTISFGDPAQWFVMPTPGSVTRHINWSVSAGSWGGITLQSGASCSSLSLIGSFFTSPGCQGFMFAFDNNLYVEILPPVMGSLTYTIEVLGGPC